MKAPSKILKSTFALALVVSLVGQPAHAALRCGDINSTAKIGGAAGAALGAGSSLFLLHRAKRIVRENTINLLNGGRTASVATMQGQRGDKITVEIALSAEKSREMFLRDMRRTRAANNVVSVVSAIGAGANAAQGVNNALDGNNANNGEIIVNALNAKIQYDVAQDSAKDAASADQWIRDVESGRKKAPQQYVKRIITYSTPERAQEWLTKITREGRVSEMSKLPVKSAGLAGAAKGAGITLALASATLAVLALEELAIGAVSDRLEQQLMSELCANGDDNSGYVY